MEMDPDFRIQLISSCKQDMFFLCLLVSLWYRCMHGYKVIPPDSTNPNKRFLLLEMRSWLTAEHGTCIIPEVKGYDTVMSVMKSVPHTPGHVAIRSPENVGMLQTRGGSEGVFLLKLRHPVCLRIFRKWCKWYTSHVNIEHLNMHVIVRVYCIYI